MRPERGHRTDMLTSEEFLKHLRDALNHLYDPHRLRQSPLAILLGVADRFDTPTALQRVLTEAIESLKPKADEPPRSHGRRIYDLLLYRYVQQFSQQEVANQLGMSVRHLRREQRDALEALACLLWEQFRLEAKVREEPDAEAPTQVTVFSPTVNDELAWLKDAPPEQSTDLDQTLPAVLDLARPLAAQHGVHLETTVADAHPMLAVHPVALRQTLLNLLSVAIHRAVSGSQVHISAQPMHWEVKIRVQCEKVSTAPRPVSDDEEATLDMAHQLAKLCGGRLILSADAGTFDSTLILPVLEQLPVLIIDDNPDTLQLLQRYAAGTRYRLIGTQDPEQAMSMAKELSPQIIVLDVMMPQIDGWEVLGRLQQHPLTSDVPIVVCTILAQEELALSLGASAFVRKPVTRQAFLAALARQVARKEPGPR
jgi:CheY-like chemotaxis protein/AraC-like DNA-binding protein